MTQRENSPGDGSYILGPFEDYGFPENTFDIVTAIHVRTEDGKEGWVIRA
jgi:hypothetical protein